MSVEGGTVCVSSHHAQCHSSLPLNVLLSGHDRALIDVDVSQLKTDEEIQNACCIKTCVYPMKTKNLVCNDFETLMTDHRPVSGTGWFPDADPTKGIQEPQTDADIKWSCCQPSEKSKERPHNPGCQALLGDSGCPADEFAMPSYAAIFNADTWNFTAASKAEVVNRCCKATCYSEFNSRGISCPAASVLKYDKNDDTNPLEQSGKHWSHIRKIKDAELQSECCKPQNKCYAQLTAMKVNCAGVGQVPGRYAHQAPSHTRTKQTQEHE